MVARPEGWHLAQLGSWWHGPAGALRDFQVHRAPNAGNGFHHQGKVSPQVVAVAPLIARTQSGPPNFPPEESRRAHSHANAGLLFTMYGVLRTS